MAGGAVRKYGRRVVVPDSELVFDSIVSGAARVKKSSPFCSSDSSHANSPCSQCLESSSLPVTRRALANVGRARKKQNSNKLDGGCGKKSRRENQPKSHDSSINLFHEKSSSFVVSTPVKGRKPRKALKEINSQTVTEKKTKKQTLGHDCQEKSTIFSSNNDTECSDLPENVPDFDSIEQDELIIDSSTPKIGEKYTAKTLGLSVSLFSPPSLTGNNSEQSLSPSSLEHASVASKHFPNVTFRRSKKTSQHKWEMKKTNHKHSPDSGNMSGDHGTNDIQELSYSHVQLADISVTDMVASDISHSHANVLHRDMDEFMNSFGGLHLSAQNITGTVDIFSSVTRTEQESFQADSVEPCLPSLSPVAVIEVSSCCRSHSIQSPSLPHIAEEDSSYSEQEFEDCLEESDEEDKRGQETDDTDSEDDDDDDDDAFGDKNEMVKEHSCSNKSDISLYELVNSMSFIEMLSNSSLCENIPVTARERVLSLCGQVEPVSFSECIPPRMMSRCVKIGEGVYGEVFRTFSQGQAVALKIIPIEGDQQVNDCPQKKFEEILPEILIAKELSDLTCCKSSQTHNFCQVKRISCVEGEFPSKLLEQWDLYSERKISENDRPDMFARDQLFIVFEFVDGGCPLENFQFSNHNEAFSVLRQVVFALAVAEEELEFEHRDLHIGNVLVQSCQENTVSFKLHDRSYEFPSEGVCATIIDFTISRLKKDGCAVFCDISTDEGMFEGTGDFQFDVYRDMRAQNGNNWQQFCPHSNILWVNYLCKKLVSAVKYKETGRNFRDVQRHLRSMIDNLLDYSSCQNLANESSLWEWPKN